MKKGDWVLVVAHHFSSALAKVAEPHKYICKTAPEIGVWFRQFRQVGNIMDYTDFITNARSWKRIDIMDTRPISERPEFQRRSVWTDTLASRLIESILLNVPIPPGYHCRPLERSSRR